MKSDLNELYRAFGYRPLATKASALTTFSDPERQELAAPAADPGELPPLDEEGIDKLTELFAHDPEQVVGEFRKICGHSITEPQTGAAIARARAMLTQPARGVEVFQATEALDSAASPLPAEFDFDGMDLDRYPIDPGNTQFETTADAVRWVTMAGSLVVYSTFAKMAPFRHHDEPSYRSRFVYKLPEPSASSPLDVALFADFGTGLYHSRYIARQLKARAYPYAIHLGDVYYAGRESEFVQYFKRDLNPILDATRLFTLGGNHERYALNIPFFNYIDERKKLAPSVQEQEGSYFCLRSERFQIVAIDTEHFGSSRYRDAELLGWAEAMLDEGRRSGCVNVLLSSNEPYAYGGKGTTELLEDLRRIVVDRKLADLWFWGNTHYCALFGATDALPFIGSCIGHGGYPYDRERPGKPSPAPVLFLETKGRFPEWTRLRLDRGNNGYCALRLKADGSLELRYIDWLGHDRCMVTLDREATRGPLAVKSMASF